MFFGDFGEKTGVVGLVWWVFGVVLFLGKQKKTVFIGIFWLVFLGKLKVFLFGWFWGGFLLGKINDIFV